MASLDDYLQQLQQLQQMAGYVGSTAPVIGMPVASSVGNSVAGAIGPAAAGAAGAIGGGGIGAIGPAAVGAISGVGSGPPPQANQGMMGGSAMAGFDTTYGGLAGRPSPAQNSPTAAQTNLPAAQQEQGQPGLPPGSPDYSGAEFNPNAGSHGGLASTPAPSGSTFGGDFGWGTGPANTGMATWNPGSNQLPPGIGGNGVSTGAAPSSSVGGMYGSSPGSNSLNGMAQQIGNMAGSYKPEYSMGSNGSSRPSGMAGAIQSGLDQQSFLNNAQNAANQSAFIAPWNQGGGGIPGATTSGYGPTMSAGGASGGGFNGGGGFPGMPNLAGISAGGGAAASAPSYKPTAMPSAPNFGSAGGASATGPGGSGAGAPGGPTGSQGFQGPAQPTLGNGSPSSPLQPAIDPNGGGVTTVAGQAPSSASLYAMPSLAGYYNGNNPAAQAGTTAGGATKPAASQTSAAGQPATTGSASNLPAGTIGDLANTFQNATNAANQGNLNLANQISAGYGNLANNSAGALGALGNLFGQQQNQFGQSASNVMQGYGNLGATQNAGYAQLLNSMGQGQAGINQGYQNVEQQILGNMGLYGQSQTQDINANYAQQQADAQQNLNDRGLGNTTIGNSVKTGIDYNRQRALINSNEGIQGMVNSAIMGTAYPALAAQQQGVSNLANLGAQSVGANTNLGQAALQQQYGAAQDMANLQSGALQFGQNANATQNQIGQNNLNWMNSINQLGPDQSVLAALAQGVGSSGQSIAGYGAANPYMQAGSAPQAGRPSLGSYIQSVANGVNPNLLQQALLASGRKTNA